MIGWVASLTIPIMTRYAMDSASTLSKALKIIQAVASDEQRQLNGMPPIKKQKRKQWAYKRTATCGTWPDKR